MSRSDRITETNFSRSFKHNPEFLKLGLPGVVFDIDEISDYRAHLSPSEFKIVQKSSLNRQNEFSTGRQLAHRALAALGCNIPSLLSGKNREPLWPPRIVGSITHTNEYAGVAVASSEDYTGIGIDIEPKGSVEPSLINMLLTNSERTKYRNIDPTQIFCSKEAIYKLLHPLINEFIDFQDVEIQLDEKRTEFRAVSVSAICPQELVAAVRGRIHSLGNNWFSCVTITR